MAIDKRLKFTSLAILSVGLAVVTMAHQQSPVLADEKPAANPLEANQGISSEPGQPPATLTTDADCKATNASDSESDPTDPARVHRGDKVKLAFYELLQSQEDKWGADHKHVQQSAKAFQLRSELSNEYLVQDDGSISVPLLGVFTVDGRKSADVQRQLECSFQSFLGRSGFVNVLSVAKQPIYIVGKVKNAGSYAYTPGMTVMHAVALAGGFDKAQMEPYQLTELAREANRLQTSLGRAMRMIARSSAVEAARSRGLPTVPTELAELAGKQKAEALLDQEFATRRTEMQALVSDEASLTGVIESASSELNLKKAQLPLLKQSIALRRERVENLAKLTASGSLARPVLIQAQSDLLEVEARSQESLVTISQAQERLNRARQDLQVRHQQAAIAMQKEATEARTEAALAAEDSDSSANVIKVMARTDLAAPNLETEFLVIRRVGNRVMQIPCGATMLLEPGDLVQTQGVSNGSGKSPSR
ncbi:SLBB domain-containing protein [Rhodoblastus sp.]|uniref:polysaccharide biosynthesis/export family protein n=1 Tax=Rhodoblastus sp. TaxID=1962975 RepID=UPI003F95F3AB